MINGPFDRKWKNFLGCSNEIKSAVWKQIPIHSLLNDNNLKKKLFFSVGNRNHFIDLYLWNRSLPIVSHQTIYNVRCSCCLCSSNILFFLRNEIAPPSYIINHCGRLLHALINPKQKWASEATESSEKWKTENEMQRTKHNHRPLTRHDHT